MKNYRFGGIQMRGTRIHPDTSRDDRAKQEANAILEDYYTLLDNHNTPNRIERPSDNEAIPCVCGAKGVDCFGSSQCVLFEDYLNSWELVPKHQED